MKTSSSGLLIPRLDAIVRETMLKIEWMKLSESRLTVEAARVFISQFGLFTRHSRRCWAYVVANCPLAEVRKFVTTHNLYEEEAMETSHYDLLVRMGLKLGLKRGEIDDARPLPTTLVALHSWEALTKNRDWLEGLTAKGVLERSNEPRCGNMSGLQAERWMRQLGLSKEDVAFWTLHEEVDQVHGAGSFDFVEKYAVSAERRESVLSSASESMTVWKVFLDGIASAVQSTSRG
jgi:pyrroloquinoline quinone (PQQ) biosynthesis protein C